MPAKFSVQTVFTVSPSVKGLRKFVNICQEYACKHGLTYNVKKTEIVIFKYRRGPDCVPPVFLNSEPIKLVESFKYLGHIITSDLTDDADIERQRRGLSVIGNMVARRFYKCEDDVKVLLFKTFCQSLYTCQLWTNYTKKSHDSIRVQYNNCFRHLMGLKKYCSASSMFFEARVNSFVAVVTHRIASFLITLQKSDNEIIQELYLRSLSTTWYKRWLEIAA
ncbi:hypothetical protein NE865_15256 [Phthorimaea operculella]|nr:hypothetical protein NE865_15256 [Phthorimaea operculella]